MVKFFDSLEIGLCLRVNSLSHNGRIRFFFSAISRLGDYPAYLITGVACAALLEDEGFAFVLLCLMTATVGVIVYKLLKNTLVRERPFISHQGIQCAAAPLDRYSFPSGHTMHAVSFAILYSAHVPEMAWLMAPFAALVAASRVILGLHYPTDVIVGACLGTLLALTSLSVIA